MNQKLGSVISRWVEVIQLMFFFLHRTSGEITKEFVTAFCESFNKFFPDFGREQSEFALAQFLHPFTKGSGLTFDNKVHKYQSIVDRICDMLKPTAKKRKRKIKASLVFAVQVKSHLQHGTLTLWYQSVKTWYPLEPWRRGRIARLTFFIEGQPTLRSRTQMSWTTGKATVTICLD